MELPEYVRGCLDALEAAGFPAYAVGGCVRDALLGRKPSDYDLCTAARPQEVQAVFSHMPQVLAGLRHGTVGVVTGGGVVEITTFRAEGAYSDRRHPDSVTFVPRVEADLARRDFTVNAMAWSPGRGLVDPFGGKADLENRLLRAVGDPAERFREDALRILRCVRFAVRYGFTVAPETLQAAISLSPLLDDLARERVFAELNGLLPWADAEALLRFSPILTRAIPELAPTVGFDQHNPHHAYDLYTHTAHVTAAVPPDPPLRWAALLHDVGKPDVFTLDGNGRGHFYGHAGQSARLAEEILRRLHAPGALRERATWLIAQHMTPLEPDRKLLRRRLGQYGPEAVGQLLALQRADMGGKGTGASAADADFDRIAEMLSTLLAENEALTVRDLAIGGRDLLALGYPEGPALGLCLNTLLDQVQGEVLPNTRASLLAAAKRMMAEGGTPSDG